jgi:Protein of unknown function (DUF1499)
MNDETTQADNVATGYDEPISPAAATVVKPARDWQAYMVLAGGIGAGLWGLFAPLGSGWGLWGWKSGLTGVQWSFFLAVGALLLGLLYIWRGRRTGRTRRPLLWLGTLISAGYSVWMLSLVAGAASVPAIHDISTDLADPPQFAVLSLRADNLDNIPGADDSEMKGMSPVQRWTLLHQKEYGDIRSVRIDQPMNAVMAKAARLATERDWKIASNVPSEGRLEATATTALFRFKDDIVLRVRPTEDGRGSIADMRSVSRVGQSDLGVNAKRVRAFLADLSGTVTAAE